MKHKLISFLACAILIGICAVIGFTAVKETGFFDQLVWRPFAIFYIAAIIGSLLVLGLILKSHSRKGMVYWFSLFVSSNVLWLFTLLGICLSAKPEVSVFWQAMGPLGWLMLPTFILFFCITYIDDTDLPRSIPLWITAILGPIVIIYFTGSTNLIEAHTPQVGSLRFYGYEFEGGSLQDFTFIWALFAIVTSLILLTKTYRRISHPRRKRQVRIFLIGLGQYVLSGAIFEILLPLSIPISNDLYNYIPYPTPIYTLALSLIVGYGILRYGVFQINPASLSETILESLSEAVFGLNLDLEIEFANSGAETIFGYQQDVLKGKSAGILFHDSVYHELQTQVKLGKRYFEIDDTTAMSVNKTGVPVMISMSQVRDEAHKLAGYILVVANISEIKKKSIELAKEKASVERKVIERTRELSETFARLTASVNSINLGFIMTDDQGSVILENDAAGALFSRLSGSKEIISNWNLNALAKVLNESLDLKKAVGDAQAQGKGVQLTEVKLHEYFLQIFLAPVIKDGKHLGTVMVFEDVTEAKVLERSRDEFFSIASHELRTPLTLLRGNVELIHDYYKESITSDEVLRMIDDMGSSSTKLIDIVNDFLDMSSLEQGKIQLRPQNIKVNDFAAGLIALRNDANRNKEISFNFEAADEDKEQFIDQERLTKALNRLISNAEKFTPKGTITLSVEHEGTNVVYRVQDTGIGIKPENRPLLFHKFQQAGSSLLTRDSQGTGLGLYICKLLVTALGGEVIMKKSVVGEGTIFRMTLPLKQSEHRDVKQLTKQGT